MQTSNFHRPTFVGLLVMFFGITFGAHAQIHSPRVTVVVNSELGVQTTVRYATGQLLAALADQGGNPQLAQSSTQPIGPGTIILALKTDQSATSRPESFDIQSGKDGILRIIGADPVGLLWGVRDFVHYHCKPWLNSLQTGSPLQLEFYETPAIQNRGLWSWWHGCWDPYAYVDRASEWKLNTVCFWNRGVPLDAERLNNYAHERGVRIWWGFSWGWTADDFKDASPPLAKRLLAMYEEQKKRIGPGLNVLCPSDPKTPQALLDYVLDVYEKQYAWIPNIDGIYFQTATEAVCPCERCKTAPRGEGFIRTMLPIIEELHRRYPKVLISCGVHNTGDIDTFKALKQIPSYANICWEAGVTWATNKEVFRNQLSYRGGEEDFAGVYRITMNCGLVLRGAAIRNESPRLWLPRVEKLWDYLEEGQPEGSGQGYKLIKVGDQEIGYPCTSDWRPPAKGEMVDNKNFRELLEWSRELAQGTPRRKGIFLLVEAGMLDLKMRRVPAMAAEVIWNPTIAPEELNRRASLIWNRKVGGWREPANPYWDYSVLEGAETEKAGQAVRDLGDIYRKLSREEADASRTEPTKKEE